MKLPLLIHADVPTNGPWVLLESGSWHFESHESVMIEDASGTRLQSPYITSDITRVRAILIDKLPRPININAEKRNVSS